MFENLVWIALACTGTEVAPAPPSSWLAFVVQRPGAIRHTCVAKADGSALSCPAGGKGAFPASVSPQGDRLLVVETQETEGGAHRERLATLSAGGHRVLTPWNHRTRAPTWHPHGRRVIYESSASGFSDLWAVSMDGSEPSVVVQHAAGNFEPSLHPDGDRTVFISSRTGDAELHVAEGDSVELLHASPGDDMRPRWSPDGRWIGLLTAREGRRRVWLIDGDGDHARPLLTTGTEEHVDFAWSPSSQLLAVVARPGTGDTDLLVVRVDDGEVLAHLDEPSTDEHPAWSDDEQLAFTCTEDHRSAVCTWSANPGVRRVAIRLDDGDAWLPRWLPPELAQDLAARSGSAP